jgi:dephospho-CoA kinase
MAARPFTVALTGGIASGKSAVAQRLARLGAEVIDADVVARELVEPGTPSLKEIVEAFGPDVLDADGRLARRRLRERVFEDAAQRQRLESILHPRVRERLELQSRTAAGPYVVLVIPLLVESGAYGWVDRVLVVDAPRDLQLERLVLRDGVDARLAGAMLDAQSQREHRLGHADFVILNSGSLAELNRETDAIHRQLVEMARAKREAGA